MIEKSGETPVVVDFWAPGCRPCVMLGPLLEKLETEYGGGFILAKVNIDENREVAAHYSVRSIPFVKLFRDGNPIGEFLGAQPEEKVRKFLGRFLPAREDPALASAEASYSEGDIGAAVKAYEAALGKDRENEKVRLRLGELYIESADYSAAKEALLPLIHSREAERLLDLVYFKDAAPVFGEELRAKLRENPSDMEARIALGSEYARLGEYGASLDEFIEAVKTDKNYRDALPRKLMLRIFRILGENDPLVGEYRNRLSDLIF